MAKQAHASYATGSSELHTGPRSLAMDEVRRVMLEGVAKVCIHVRPEQQQTADLQGNIIANGLLTSRSQIMLPLSDNSGRFVSPEAALVAETLGGLFRDLLTPEARRTAGKAIAAILAAESPLDLRGRIAKELSPLFSFLEDYDGGTEFTKFVDERLGELTN